MSQDKIKIDPGVPAPSDAPAVPDTAPEAIETQPAAGDATPAAVDTQAGAPESTPDAVESPGGASEAPSAALETEADAPEPSPVAIDTGMQDAAPEADVQAVASETTPAAVDTETQADAPEASPATVDASDLQADLKVGLDEGGPETSAAAGQAGPHTEAPETAAATPDAPTDALEEAPAVVEEPVVTGPSAELKAIVEALIFASPEPITPRTLFKLLADEPKEDVGAAIAALRGDYENRAGLQLVEVAGGYQIVTRPELHDWVRRLFHERSTQKLTVQGLETLAVIAYKQPITAAEIAEIRGVNTSGVLSTLLERHLIKIVGRKNVVGRPFLYSTTKEFLIRFGLKDLGDLPRIEDMAEALGFDPPAGLIERTPGEDILPLEEPNETEDETAAPSATDVATTAATEEASTSGSDDVAQRAAADVSASGSEADPASQPDDASQDRRPDDRPEEA